MSKSRRFHLMRLWRTVRLEELDDKYRLWQPTLEQGTLVWLAVRVAHPPFVTVRLVDGGQKGPYVVPRNALVKVPSHTKEAKRAYELLE